MNTDEATKRAVMDCVCNGVVPVPCGRATLKVGTRRVHIRLKRQPSHAAKFPFNINPNTLRSDYEVWICGSPDIYFLIPASVIREMYGHPNAYPDFRHPDIRIITVDAVSMEVTYASPSITKDVRQYFRGILSN